MKAHFNPNSMFPKAIQENLLMSIMLVKHLQEVEDKVEVDLEEEEVEEETIFKEPLMKRAILENARFAIDHLMLKKIVGLKENHNV